MKRMWILPAAALLAAACASAPDDAATSTAGAASSAPRRYDGEPGPSPVGAIPNASLPDPHRGRELPLSIEYPTRGGPHPVIIFSHGFGGSREGYVGLSSHWASHGYVVIKPSHADAGAMREAMRERMQERREERREGNRPPRMREDIRDTVEEAWDAQTQEDWVRRAGDITYILDSLATLEERYPELKGKMDTTRIGVGGHSYGAFTTMLIAGTTTSAGTSVTRYADPRVKAGLAMSPQGIEAKRGLTADSWRGVAIPMLYMTGSNDRGASEGQDATWRRGAYENSPAGNKWLVWIEGATHASFSGRFSAVDDRVWMDDRYDPYSQRRGDLGTVRPRPSTSRMANETSIFSLVKAATTAFWDAYLKNEPAGTEYLRRLDQREDVEVLTK